MSETIPLKRPMLWDNLPMSLVDRASQAVEELIALQRTQDADFPIRTLDGAEPFYWERQIVDVVEAAMQSLPRWTVRSELFPVQRGFFWFSRPIARATGRPIRAIAWAPRSTSWSKKVAGDWEIAGFSDAADDDNRRVEFNQTLGPVAGILQHNNDASDELYFQAERFLGASLLFLEQKLAVISNGNLDRSARRRFEKADIEYPPLRVIRLRTVHRFTKSDESESVDWQFRWLVRGHWRQQFYASDSSHRPIWITPHVKGPEDKPLKAPKQSVFAVVR